MVDESQQDEEMNEMRLAEGVRLLYTKPQQAERKVRIFIHPICVIVLCNCIVPVQLSSPNGIVLVRFQSLKSAVKGRYVKMMECLWKNL